MGYAVKDDLTVILSTHISTRKWHCLKINNQVALVFGWDFTELNIQYEGTATLITDTALQEYHDTERFFFTQNPSVEKFKSPDTVFIMIKPTWIRSTDLTTSPPTIKEDKTE